MMKTLGTSWVCVLMTAFATGVMADSQQICATAVAGHQEIGGSAETSSNCSGSAAVANHSTIISAECSALSSASAVSEIGYLLPQVGYEIRFLGTFSPSSQAWVSASGCFCSGPSPGAEYASAATSADLDISESFSLASFTYYKIHYFDMISSGTPSGSVSWEIKSGFATLESGSLSGSGSTAPRCFTALPGNYVFSAEVNGQETLSASTDNGCSDSKVSNGWVSWSLWISAISCPSGNLSLCCHGGGRDGTEE